MQSFAVYAEIHAELLDCRLTARMEEICKKLRPRTRTLGRVIVVDDIFYYS